MINVSNIKVGDVFELSDYHALQICKGTFQVVIRAVSRYCLDSLTITVMTFEYQGDTMAIVAKSIGDDVDYFVYRMWESGLYVDIIRDLGLDEDEDVEGNETMPCGFAVDMDGESIYEQNKPFPLFGFTCDYESYGIGEYTLTDEHDETYWAINAMMIWNISPDEDESDLENYAMLYFGWPVNVSDINFIRS